MYFGDIPVGVYQNNQMYFVHTDHLNTPRAITNSSQTLMWKWENVDPFGKNAPVNSGIDFNLRYSGQYFDGESGLHYNYYRYYNPETGRYMQVDPIGIRGGYDTYGYVNQNPLKYSDPLGLLLRDANGNLIYTFAGKQSYWNIANTKILMQPIYLYTDKNNPVLALINLEQKRNNNHVNYDSDCHGWTFTNGKYWINNNQIYTILRDEYVPISKNEAKIGDIVIYREGKNIVHSTTINKIDSNISVFGKGGNEPFPYITNIDKSWVPEPGKDVEHVFFRKISK